MRTVNYSVPVNMVIPDKYLIEIKLDGNNSVLVDEETFVEPNQDLIDRTVVLVKSLNVKGAEIEQLSNGFRLTIRGNEFTIISGLLGALNLLRVYKENNEPRRSTGFPARGYPNQKDQEVSYRQVQSEEPPIHGVLPCL